MIIVNYRNNQCLTMSTTHHINLLFIILMVTFISLFGSTYGQQLVTSSSSSSSSPSKTCNQLEIQTDRLIKRILLLNGDQPIPRIDKDLQSQCKSARKGFTLATKYQQCLPPFPRQILALLISGAGKAFRHICSDQQSRSQILDSLTCLNNENIGRVYSLLGRALTIVEYIGRNVTSDIMILPYGCCTYHFIYDRGIRLLDNLCPSKSNTVTRLISNLLDLTLSEIIEIGCSKYSSLSICVKKIPQVVENIKSARSPLPIKSLADRSFIQPVLTIANRLIDDPTIKTKDDKKSSST